MTEFIVEASGWLFRERRAQPGAVRLFCFPHAGGAASSYKSWGALCPSDVELCLVELPGRASRFAEVSIAKCGELVAAAADALASHLDRQFAFFGHSMGALVAFELARELRRRGWPLPCVLAVSAFRSPDWDTSDPPLADLSDGNFVMAVDKRYNAIPSVMMNDPDLLRLVVPPLRADMKLLESYAYASESPLTCPISAFGGSDDLRVSREALAAWRRHTRDRFSLRLFPGGHFYHQSAGGPVLEALVGDIRRVRSNLLEAAP